MTTQKAGSCTSGRRTGLQQLVDHILIARGDGNESDTKVRMTIVTAVALDQASPNSTLPSAS